MAPIELKDLSGNWKELQKTLRSSKSPSSKLTRPSKSKEEEENKPLKRTRSSSDAHPHSSRTVGKHSVNDNGETVPKPTSRKRQKMDEPPTIGASKKHHDTHTLRPSVSMPHLKSFSSALLVDPSAAAAPVSVLAPSLDHPDIENEGLSSTALPGKYIALDCEMVGVGPEPDRDSALARVSIVNYHGHQVYDSYVLPTVLVTDYRTPVSGIEPRHLEPDIARSFQEVQRDIKILLDGRILVGHGIKNDLGALILNHPERNIRDTSKHPKFKELATLPGRTPGLKKLVSELLGVEIQVGHHSSVEDARATMALFKLDKQGFENGAVRKYGHIKLPGEERDMEDGHPVKRMKNKKKKKKKKA